MTEEQYNALAPYEPNFKTALECNYSRYPGQEGVTTMFNIYRDLTHTRMNLNRSCSVCILNLVKSLGKLYFAEKTRREEEARKAEELKKEEPKAEPKPDKAKKTSRKKKESK